MSAVILESSLAHYEALGRGKPLLFLHGWLGSWRYWVPTMVALSSSYRAYALDFWGFGDSDKIRARYSIDSYVAQVALFMQQLGLPQIPIVGHGLGGVVALRFARQYPDQVEQLLLSNVPFVADAISRTLSGFDGGENPAARILGRRLNEYQEVALEAAKTDGDAVVNTLRSVSHYDLEPILEDLDIPVMLLYGTQDPLIQVPGDGVIDDLEENVNILLMDGVQHFPMLEDTSKFTRLVLDFLIHRDNWDAIEVKAEWRRRMR